MTALGIVIDALFALLWALGAVALVREGWRAGERSALVHASMVIWPVTLILFFAWDALCWIWHRSFGR